MRQTMARLVEQQLTHRVMARPLQAAVYRGGTSRGLIFREDELAPYSQADRDKILCAAMGSPDPDGRQINGLGAGTSSTSKVAIVHRCGSKITSLARSFGDPFPGLSWLDEKDKVREIGDVVYRFGQVIIKQEKVDWGSTCGNMVAAAALFALAKRMVRTPKHLSDSEIVTEDEVRNWTVRLIAHDTGKVVNAHVPVVKVFNEDKQHSYWEAKKEGDTAIAGVPGTASGILIETPLEGSVLPTGNEKDVIDIDGKKIGVSIVDTGLPVVIVSAQSMDIPISQLLEHPTSIESNTGLMERLERVRQEASSLTPSLQQIFSTPSPKLCVAFPRCDYTSTGGQIHRANETDLMVRIVSSGQLHRTIPATTLSALAAARSFASSIVGEMTGTDSCEATLSAETKFASYTIAPEESGAGLQSITVGQPAGCSTASVRLDASDVPPMPNRIAMIDACDELSGNKKKQQQGTKMQGNSGEKTIRQRTMTKYPRSYSKEGVSSKFDRDESSRPSFQYRERFEQSDIIAPRRQHFDRRQSAEGFQGYRQRFGTRTY